MPGNNSTKTNLSVQHNFEGDAGVLNATLERRTDVRKALTALAQELQKLQGRPIQVKAEINLQVGGNAPKEHVYSITITDSGFDADDFARSVPQNERNARRSRGEDIVSSPRVAAGRNGQQATPRLDSRLLDINDEIVEIRPFKRQRTITGAEQAAGISQQHHASPLTHLPQPPMPMPTGVYESLAYLRNWHDEWTRQGGWLFDMLNKTHSATTVRGSLEKKLDTVQDVLGQSMNASSASTITELGSITKLIHWLEYCRKASADKVQAREEKWRSSSATFHDSARREREAAEKRIETRLDEQNALLVKLAQANNIGGVKLGNVSAKSDERSREASLGAQLTAELNMKAGRHGDSEDEPYSIDD